MTVFSRTWNGAYEASPADTQNISLGATRIREVKADVQERGEVDHSWAGTVDDGMHKKVTLVDPLAAKPVQANDETYLYSKDVTGKAELFFEDEDGDEVQLTDGGSINALQTVDNGDWSGTDLAVANGGTGGSTENAARENLGIYHGRVQADGTEIRLPAGWSSVRNSSGKYTLTHSLGLTTYSIVANTVQGAGIPGGIVAKSSTACTFWVLNQVSSVYVDLGWDFTLIVD